MERMSAPHALTVLFTACVAFSTQAQTPNVRLDVWDGKGYQPCEPSIAMDPNNPDVVVAWRAASSTMCIVQRTGAKAG